MFSCTSEWTFNSQLTTTSHNLTTLAQFPVGPIKQWSCTHFCHSVPTLSTLLTADWPQLLTLHFSSATNIQTCSNLKILCAGPFQDSALHRQKWCLYLVPLLWTRHLLTTGIEKRVTDWRTEHRKHADCVYITNRYICIHTHTHKFEQRTAHQQVSVCRGY